MAVFDWNHDGKKDIQDDFLEHNIYNSSGGGGGKPEGPWVYYLYIFFMFILPALMSSCYH